MSIVWLWKERRRCIMANCIAHQNLSIQSINSLSNCMTHTGREWVIILRIGKLNNNTKFTNNLFTYLPNQPITTTDTVYTITIQANRLCWVAGYEERQKCPKGILMHQISRIRNAVVWSSFHCCKIIKSILLIDSQSASLISQAKPEWGWLAHSHSTQSLAQCQFYFTHLVNAK